MTIVVATLVVVVIALSGICFYLLQLTEKIRQEVELNTEWQSTATDLFETISTEQDKDKYRLSVAEERILNLQNRTGQIQIKLRQMDANTIYEVKDGQ